MSLLAEDLLLLVTDDETGRQTLDTTRLDLALGGAVLLELALAGRASVLDRPGWFASDVVVLDDTSSFGDPVWTRRWPCWPRSRAPRRTSCGGRGRGCAPACWPAEDPGHERQVRARPHDVLVVGVDPDERTAALAALLVSVDRAHTVPPGWTPRSVGR